MPEFPAPRDGIVLTHFIVSRDVERSRRFYTDVLGGETVLEGEPSIVALANGWIIINVGGGADRRQADRHARDAIGSRARLELSQRPGRRHPGGV